MIQNVIFSRDVVFNEKKHGIEKENSTEEEIRYIQIKCLGYEEQVDKDTGEPPQPTIEEQPEPVLRRSARERQPPDYYGVRVNVASEASNEPTSMTEALARAKWMDAMNKEMDSLHMNDVWDLVKLPKDRKAVGSKWVFKFKVGPKARLVAQGFSQKQGLHGQCRTA